MQPLAAGPDGVEEVMVVVVVMVEVMVVVAIRCESFSCCVLPLFCACIPILGAKVLMIRVGYCIRCEIVVVWFDEAWFGLVQFGRFGLVWFGLVRSGSVWVGLVWFGFVWFGLVWFGLVWLSLVRCDRFCSVRRGSVRFGSLLFSSVRFGSVRFGLFSLCCVWLRFCCAFFLCFARSHFVECVFFFGRDEDVIVHWQTLLAFSRE